MKLCMYSHHYGQVEIYKKKLFNFFIYDTLKIFLLLTVIIFVVSIVRTYFSPEKT